MAISFAESIQQLQAAQAISFRSVPSETQFVESSSYEKYVNYSDSKLSTINEQRSIQLDSSQVNLTQEINSQFIPFEMPRYYDGIDLMSMTLLIHYVNPENKSEKVKPVNVSSSTDKIRFAWLVDERVTAIAGDIKFEIIAYGTNEKQQKYVWKSLPNGKLTILPSLSGNGIIPPSEPGYMDFLAQVEQTATQAQTSANTANNSAVRAETAALKVEQNIDGVKQEITQQVNANVDSKLDGRLKDYYTKPEVDIITDNIMPDEIYGGASKMI